MNFNEEFKERILERFNKHSVLNGMQLKAWLKNNKDIECYLNEILQSEPRYFRIYNIVWSLINDFDINEFKCKTCGKLLTLKIPTNMLNYCSNKCAMNNKELIEKRNTTISKDVDYYNKRNEKTKCTNLKKYGVEHSFQSEVVKEKIKQKIDSDPEHWNKRYEKTKITSMQHYGVENPSQAYEIKEKKATTCLEHFGVDCTFKSNTIKEKIKNTLIEKYGVDNPFKLNKRTIDKSWETINSWKEFVVPNFTREEYTGYSQNQEYEWKCVKCGELFRQSLYHTKHLDFNDMIPRCLKCYPKDYVSSAREKELLDFIKLYFPNAKKDRELIAPYELDIVIPELKLAIEFDGDYWHSINASKDKNYHLMKTEMCEQIGYRLIHIFEHEWKFKKDIVKSKLNTILGVNEDSIYARKCIVKEIDSKMKNEFLNKYHIQGEDKSDVKLGLFYENDLVAVMTFGKPRFNKKYEFELIRYATSRHVIGGAGKLLAYFKRNFNPKSIVTYADRRWSNGNMYRQIGFSQLENSGPGYFYVKGETLYTRIQCQKHKLKNILGDKFNEELSETENMTNNGFLKIYDCGNYVFEMVFD